MVSALGPGLTNTLTGLAQANLCGFPVVALCGQKPVRDNSEGSFQVLDLPAIAAPVTKWADDATDPATLAADTARALAVCLDPRPGPVLLVIPEDIAGESGQDGDVLGGPCRFPPVAAPEQTCARARR